VTRAGSVFCFQRRPSGGSGKFLKQNPAMIRAIHVVIQDGPVFISRKRPAAARERASHHAAGLQSELNRGEALDHLKDAICNRSCHGGGCARGLAAAQGVLSDGARALS